MLKMLKNKLYVYGDDNIQVPAHCNYGKYLLDQMIKHQDILAIINADTNENMTYGEVAQRVVDIALSLAHMGFKKGEVASICSEKRMENLPTIVGCICAGLTYSPLDPTCGEATFLHRLHIAKPTIVFCSSDAYKRHCASLRTAESIRMLIIYEDYIQDTINFSDFVSCTADVNDFIPVPVDGWTDNAFIMFSSGTTGLPKGIPNTHFSFLVFNRPSVVDELCLGVPMLCTREWYYTYGLHHTLACFHMLSTVVYLTDDNEEDMLRAIQNYKIKTLQVCSTTVNQLVNSSMLRRYDVSSLEFMMCTGTPCDRELVLAAKRVFPKLVTMVQFYGMTESGRVCSTLLAPSERAGSVGWVNPGVVVKVVDLKTRQPLGPNQRGEICFKSLSLMKGYLKASQQDYLDEEGFFKSGDVGYYDEDKYFYVLDRIKEMIKYHDISVAPAEFEAVLVQHAAVREAGVVGAPHPACGEVPVAFVVLQPGGQATEDELVRYVNRQMSTKTLLVGGVRFVDELPRGAGAKLDRKALRRML